MSKGTSFEDSTFNDTRTTLDSTDDGTVELFDEGLLDDIGVNDDASSASPMDVSIMGNENNEPSFFDITCGYQTDVSVLGWTGTVVHDANVHIGDDVMLLRAPAVQNIAPLEEDTLGEETVAPLRPLPRLSVALQDDDLNVFDDCTDAIPHASSLTKFGAAANSITKTWSRYLNTESCVISLLQQVCPSHASRACALGLFLRFQCNGKNIRMYTSAANPDRGIVKHVVDSMLAEIKRVENKNDNYDHFKRTVVKRNLSTAVSVELIFICLRRCYLDVDTTPTGSGNIVGLEDLQSQSFEDKANWGLWALSRAVMENTTAMEGNMMILYFFMLLHGRNINTYKERRVQLYGYLADTVHEHVGSMVRKLKANNLWNLEEILDFVSPFTDEMVAAEIGPVRGCGAIVPPTDIGQVDKLVVLCIWNTKNLLYKEIGKRMANGTAGASNPAGLPNPAGASDPTDPSENGESASNDIAGNDSGFEPNGSMDSIWDNDAVDLPALLFRDLGFILPESRNEKIKLYGHLSFALQLDDRRFNNTLFETLGEVVHTHE